MKHEQPKKVIRLKTRCGCWRDMEVPIQDKTPNHFEMPMAKDIKPWQDPPPDDGGRIITRRFLYHESILSDRHLVDVYLEDL